jgi:hypothetical protein
MPGQISGAFSRMIITDRHRYGQQKANHGCERARGDDDKDLQTSAEINAYEQLRPTHGYTMILSRSVPRPENQF